MLIIGMFFTLPLPRLGLILGILGILGIVGGIGVIGWRWLQPKATTVKPVIFRPVPTPTPKAIPHGKQTFSVSSAKKTGPQFRSGTIDPYDPAMGSPMRVTVTILGAKATRKATMTVKTDNAIQEVPMELLTAEAGQNAGTWAASWIANDTYLYTWNLVLKATDGVEENIVEITLR